jgi:DNA-binding NarL/FixJ family response regulator
MGRITVLLADDHPIVTEGLQALLQREFDLVGMVHDGRSLVSTALALRPDVIVSDIFMPMLNGLDAAKQLRAQNIESKIVVLTMYIDASLAAQAFRSGASAFVVKHAAGQELVHAIKIAMNGGTFLSPLIGESVDLVLERALQPEHKIALTARQREVLQLIGEGKTMKEIGNVLGISSRTAETHKYEIMHALSASTSAELVVYAIRLGLISPGILAASADRSLPA